ncbi:MAG TPA: cytochrome b N-terminal domain-containing protein [Candidatus Thermoplasmatota archaeon]|nr:cytochrome b N-terminal domain-containing protein [Candidatus Thermoplasmatota archaeon]
MATESPQAGNVTVDAPRIGRKRPVRRVTPSQKMMLAAFAWLDERFRLRDYTDVMKDFYYEMNLALPRSHTEKYKLRSIWYWYPLYSLGSVSLLAFLVAVVSGVLLALYYVPSQAPAPGWDDPNVSVAWASVIYIMTEVPFGYMLRSIHFWSAMIMVAAVFLHMMRVYFTQAYKKPRELNWLVGLGLFGVTILLGYTGYLLPWSQLSLWAGTIGLEMSAASPIIGKYLQAILFGGTAFNPALNVPLTRMYVLHIFLLPAAAFGLIVVHLVIVWLQGIAEPH